MKWFERRYIWLPAVAAILVVAAFACGDGGAPSTPTPTATTPTATLTPTPAASPDGSPTATPTATPVIVLPPGILEEFPVYPGAELVESEIEESKVVARYEAADSRQAVSEFYQGVLAQAPWVVQAVLEPGEETTLLLFSDRVDPDINGTVAIRIPPDDGITEIIVEIVTPSGVTLTPTPLAE